MLRKRSRTVASKQAIVGDQSNLPLLANEKPAKPTSFFWSSSKIFKSFFTISSSSSSSSKSSEPIMSPTSIVTIANNLWAETKIPTPKPSEIGSCNTHSWDQKNNTKGIGLALVDDYETFEPINTSNKQQKRKLVVFGSQLKIQVPPLPSSPVFPCFSPDSPQEFGIKTPRSHLSPFGNGGDCDMVKESISVSDINMEDSEDYTCVISYGPNPKTTHIFGNCIVGRCCGVNESPSFLLRRNGSLSPLGNSVVSEESFLSFCHHCKKKLGEGKDIYMYRGEKAFCSQECRCQEMVFDGVEN